MMLSACGTDPSSSGPTPAGPLHNYVEGFAKAANVTGGYGGTNIVVTNLNNTGAGSLRQALSTNGKRYITFTPGLSGKITLTSGLYIDDGDVTVDGDGASISLAGESLNVFTGSETAVTNVILHGITFTDTTAELNALRLDFGSRNIWVDHCTFYNNSNGFNGQPVSIRNRTVGENGNTGVTFSWNHFQAPNIKSILIGSSNTETAGLEARISLHHNWFDTVDARNPRISFATVHLWNNYLSNWVEYGIVASIQSEVLVQNNIFENSSNSYGLLTNYNFPTDPAASDVSVSGNLLLGSPSPTLQTVGTFPSARITYSALVETANAALKQKIIANAGAGHSY
jgi:pectate lyase